MTNNNDDTKEKRFDSKNIKFFYSNENDMKILNYLSENKLKFSTLVKELLISYIDNGKKENKEDVEIELDESIEIKIKQMIENAISEYSPPSVDKTEKQDIKIQKEKPIEEIKEKVENKTQKPNILKQIKKLK